VIAHVQDLAVEGRRVFLRVDFNVPLTKDRRVADDARIQAALPTVRHLIDRGARIVIGSHLGRPKGKPTPEYSLEPVAQHLAGLLDLDVALTDEPVGDGARKVVADLRDGQVALLENLRFDPGEEANDDGFAQTLASYADVYVNDAFGTAHRAHASTVGMVGLLADKAAGFVMHEEIAQLGRLLGEVDRPYLAILGGAKVSDKIEVLDALIERVQGFLIGGAMANTFLRAQGVATGASRVEEDKLAVAKGFLRKAEARGVAVHLPTDVVCAAGLDDASGVPCRIEVIPHDQMALDVGPETARRYAAEIARARTIFWNGPMGVFEKPRYAAGTLAVAHAVADNARAFSVVGGGDSVAAIHQAGVAARIGHVSTGGGASLEFVQGLTLPGIAALERDR
jgi:phosphoglycerate kinase